MPDLHGILKSDAFVVFAALWVVGWLLASLLVRRANGKSVFAPSSASFQFAERWASGRSLDNWLSKLGGAGNCLFVGVDRNQFIVQPQFPFSLGFLPDLYRLEHEVPLQSIVRVESHNRLLRRVVTIEYKARTGTMRTVELGLRRPDDFLGALKGHVNIAP
jgi:hypothetical protein